VITIQTESGSIYELDTQNKRIRRVHGRSPAPSRLPAADWRTYKAIGPVQEGLSLFVAWPDESVGVRARPGAIPGMVTSRVVRVELA
jgi:hypothetical protein